VPDACFTITITRHDTGSEAAHSRIRLTGELDMSCSDDLLTAVTSVVASDITGTVIVDLDNVSFIDSVAVRTLLEGYRAADEAGKSLQIRNAHGVVREILSILGLLLILDPSAQ
jgi:anti-anti-sigma factor